MENFHGLWSISFIDGGQIQKWWQWPKVYGRIFRSFASSSYNRSSSRSLSLLAMHLLMLVFDAAMVSLCDVPQGMEAGYDSRTISQSQ
jgi:hypothetical protein